MIIIFFSLKFSFQYLSFYAIYSFLTLKSEPKSKHSMSVAIPVKITFFKISSKLDKLKISRVKKIT
mgnify:CR=1 FL=1